MHELSLAVNILEIAERSQQRSGAQQIVSIELEIGQLSAVEPAALRFAMDALLPESAASGARVDYRFIAGRAHCRQCGQDFELAFYYDPCPLCDSFDKEILAGDDMLVKSVGLA